MSQTQKTQNQMGDGQNVERRSICDKCKKSYISYRKIDGSKFICFQCMGEKQSPYGNQDEDFNGMEVEN